MALPPRDAGSPKKKPYKRPAPAAQPGPYTNSERKRVKKFKKTKPYRSAIKQAYKSRPVAERHDRVERAQAKPKGQRSTEDKAVLDTHAKRKRRDAVLMNSKPNARQQKILKEYTAAHPTTTAKPKMSADDIYETDPKKLAKLGFKKAGILDAAVKTPINLLGSGLAVAEATYHDPISVPVKTVKQGGAAIAGVPAGVVELARHPIKTTTKGVEEFGKRTSEKVSDKVKRIRKEGAFVDAADAALLVAPSSGLRGALVKAGVTRPAEHAALRVSGNVVKRRSDNPGVVKSAVRRRTDDVRARRLERELKEAEDGGQPMDAVRREAARANRRAGHVVEVVPARRGHAQVRSVAKARGRGIRRFKGEQATRLAVDQKALHRLDKKEKRAFYFATVFGIRTAAQARDLLPKLKASIEANRDFKVKGSLKKTDLLPEIEKILADPEGHFTPKLGEVVEGLREDATKAAHEDPALTPEIIENRRHADQAALLGVHRGEREGHPYNPDETDAEHVARVKAAATNHGGPDVEGLASPLYFKSERYAGPVDYASRALGGRRAMKRDARHQGKNLAAGLVDTSPAQFIRGKARNIKRAHNWRLVADTLDEHRIGSLAPEQGMPLGALRDAAVKAGVDLDSIAFWNPGVYRKSAERTETRPDADFEAAEDFDAGHVAKALRDATTPNTTSGWQAVPAHVLKEMEDQTSPSGKFGRSADITKGKLSRAILLTGNVPWLGFQVVGNAAMGTVASGGRLLNPANWVGAARLWRELDDADRHEVNSYLGMDVTGSDTHQVKMGAAVKGSGRPAAFVNSYRALKAHPMWHTGVVKGHGPSVSELNPLELMARADRSQNNVFRGVAAYSNMKKQAVRAMGKEMTRTEHAQAKIAHIFTMPPKEQFEAIIRDPELLEEHADSIADWMGDYTTMSAAERKSINRLVMFYPYVRYSLRLAFWTMPVKHPAMTALLAEIGELHADEIRKLFGDDQLFWNIGKVYFGEKGDVKSIDIRKAHPALNALIDAANAQNPGQLVGMLPPYFGWLYDQSTHRANFQDRDWRVLGRAAGYGVKHKDFGVETRARIMLDDALSLYFPKRVIQKQLDGGKPQGDDSLPWDLRPTVFKGVTRESKLKAKASKAQAAFDHENQSLLGTLFPAVVPAPNRDAEVAKEHRDLTKLKKTMAREKRTKKKTKYFGTGG